jgi:hypothetical protein
MIAVISISDFKEKFEYSGRFWTAIPVTQYRKSGFADTAVPVDRYRDSG